jgi:hypothetical protein
MRVVVMVWVSTEVTVELNVDVAVDVAVETRVSVSVLVVVRAMLLCSPTRYEKQERPPTSRTTMTTAYSLASPLR